MPYHIRKKGSKFCVYGPSGNHGCHDTREQAIGQQRALYAAERRKGGLSRKPAKEAAEAMTALAEGGAAITTSKEFLDGLSVLRTSGDTATLPSVSLREDDSAKTEMWNLRLTPETKRLWGEAAEAEGLTLSEYVREIVTERALAERVAESEGEMAAIESEEQEQQADVEAESGEVLAAAETEEEEDSDASDLEQESDAYEREPWEGVLGTIGSPTSDGRYLIPDRIENRELPVPFSVQPALAEGHEGALVAGRIEKIEYVPFADFDHKDVFYSEEQIATMPDHAVVVFASGTVDASPAGQEAKRQIDNGADVSIDGLRIDGSIWDAETFAEVDTSGLKMDDIFAGLHQGAYLQGLSGKIAGATVVSIGAFEEAHVSVIVTASASLRIVPQESAAVRFASLVASAGPLKPPREWFEDPKLTELTALRITKEGRVYGHLCDWNGCHTGFTGVCVPPFRSASNYAYFNVGELETAEGDLVPCGKLMFSMDGGKHADMDQSLTYLDVQRHYDDATKVGAFVRAGSDRFGTWLAGVLRPGLNELEIQHLRAHPPSGDWRPVRGTTDLVAAFAVPIPGYPISRGQALVASVAGGEVTAIITAPLELEDDTAYSRRRKRLKEAMSGEGKPRTRADMRRELAERLANGPWYDGFEELAVAITADQRRKWAASGVAMSDGSYPVTKCSGEGTSAENARRAIGRAPDSERDAVRAHIAKRERALGCSSEE